MGRCMLKMGQLYEACTAFRRAEKEAPDSQTMKLFTAVSLAYARRYGEAEEKIGELAIDRLASSELVTLMDLGKRLGKDVSPMLEYLSVMDDTPEDQMFLIYGRAIAEEWDGAEEALQEFSNRDFEGLGNKKILFLFLADLCKLGIQKECIFRALKRIGLESLDKDAAMEALRTWNGSRAFESLTHREQVQFVQKGAKAFFLDDDVLAMLYGMLWKAQKSRDAFEHLEELTEKKNEHALLLVVEEQFENFGDMKVADLQTNLQTLVQLDQQNMLYRKYLYDFLLQIGDVNGAGIINKASIQVRLQQEERRFSLIAQFRRLYHMEKECPVCHGKNKEDCPICMGTGYMPFIRTIAFNSSPNRIFCEHPEVKYAQADSEEEFHALFDWQPMNVPSQIAGTYLMGKGAYPSDVPFPDVMVPGQTYIFLRLKKEAYERLAEDGYTISQIDPLIPVLMSHRKLKFKVNFGTEGKAIQKRILSASDFEIEITRAINA